MKQLSETVLEGMSLSFESTESSSQTHLFEIDLGVGTSVTNQVDNPFLSFLL